MFIAVFKLPMQSRLDSVLNERHALSATQGFAYSRTHFFGGLGG